MPETYEDISYNTFLKSLKIEFNEYEKLSFKNFGDTGEYLSRTYKPAIHDKKQKYLDLLEYSYRFYEKIIIQCKNTNIKSGLKQLRKNTGKIIWTNQNIFKRMYWVVQDSIYYSLSKLDPEMHKINKFFVSFFNDKKQNWQTHLPHNDIFQYSHTPSSSWFRDLLWDYVIKNADEIENSPLFYAFLFTKNFTAYGSNHIMEIIEIFSTKLEEFKEKNGKSLLRFFLDFYKTRNITRMAKFEKEVKLLLRTSENIARIQKNLPKVGEGWIEETILYYKIKENIKKLKIIQHGSPKFLGRQHYDIWIPAIKVALEYQGDQHYKPVEYFGGNDSFQNQIVRDKRKKEISDKNGVCLIYVAKGYDIENILSKINQSL